MAKIQNRSLEVILKGIDGKEYIYRVELSPKEINYHDYDYAIDRAKDFHIKNVGQLPQINEGDEPITAYEPFDRKNDEFVWVNKNEKIQHLHFTFNIVNLELLQDESSDFDNLKKIIDNKTGFVSFYHDETYTTIYIPIADIYKIIKYELKNNSMHLSIVGDGLLDVTSKAKKQTNIYKTLQYFIACLHKQQNTTLMIFIFVILLFCRS
jgi:hypothetical protein